MELNTTYIINIICRSEGNDSGSFIVAEQFSCNSSKQYQNYYKDLIAFNKCGDWFENLEYPLFEVGTVVIAQINKNTNVWARGILTKVNSICIEPHEIYLIDSQRFSSDRNFQIRRCPPKFGQLILPTYYIDINFCLNSIDNFSAIIDTLIQKNQYGELSFSFVPQSVKNNVYTGELFVNKADNSVIPLKKLLKNFTTKKYFYDNPGHKPYLFSVFNPTKLNYLRNIFMPRYSNDTEKYLVSDYSDINYPDNSFYKNSDFIDKLSSTVDCGSASDYFSFSDDSGLAIKAINNCTISADDHKVYSSCSSISASNSSLRSEDSFEKKHSLSRSSVIKKLIEQQHQDTTVNYRDNNKSEIANTINTTTNVMDAVFTSSSESVTNNLSDAVSDIKQGSIVNQKTVENLTEVSTFIRALMKKRINSMSKLPKSEDVVCQPNDNVTMARKVETLSESLANTKIHSVGTLNDDIVWWSSDDES